MTSKSNPTSGRLALLDVIVLSAMAVTAAAFAVGLVLNSGIDLLAGAIAGGALFMVMASSHYVITRSSRSATVSGRLDELEEALIVLDGDLQRIDQVEDDVARLDLLNDRVERLDQTVSEYNGVSDGGARVAEIERLTQDLKQLRGRFDALRSDVETQTQAQRDEIGAELRSLEGLIKDLSRDLTAAAPLLASGVAGGSEDEVESAEIPVRLEVTEEHLLVAEAATVVDLAEASEIPLRLELADDDLDEDEPSDLLAESVSVSEVEVERDEGEEDVIILAPEEPAPRRDMNEDLRQAIEANRIDLYLQSIVTLPERKLCYFDGLTRIRAGVDEILEPSTYQDIAAREGLMPRIDNVMLVKCVQLLRRLGPESKLRGVFCNLSMQSLLDPDFFPELVEFLEENSTLGDSLTFRLSQPSVRDLGAIELASLRTLGKIGFGFSLDHVSELDLDYAGLRDHFYRFIKLEAKTLLHGMEATRAPVAAAELARHLDRFDLKLVVEKVEDEQSLERLLDYGVELAQGDLFAGPKPITPDMFSELEGVDAA
ncbi:MAG: EAL domain-containing protein [Methyloceanibacter sp.]